MSFKQLLHSSTARLLLIALVLCGIALTGTRSTEPVRAADLQSLTDPQGEQSIATTSELAPNAPSDLVVVRCVVKNVGVNYIDDVVGMHSTDCTPSAGAIQYFAVVGADSKKANQVLSISLTAIATGKHVVLTYDPADTNVPHPENNRKVLTFGIDEQ